MPDSQQRMLPRADLLAQLGWVQRLAQTMVSDASVAADVTQDVWLRTHARAIETEAGLRRWLYALTRGLVRDTRRADRRRERRERAAARNEAQPSASDVVERNALQQKVSAAVMALDEPYRSTTLYLYMDELSTAEIAQRMSVTEAAVRQRLVRARTTLKARLDRECGGVSGTWALAVLGAIPTDKLALTSASATSAGAGTVIGLELVAAAALIIGSVAAWQTFGREDDERPAREPRSAAIIDYDWDENELARSRAIGERRQVIVPSDQPPATINLIGEPANEFVRGPLQMW